MGKPTSRGALIVRSGQAKVKQEMAPEHGMRQTLGGGSGFSILRSSSRSKPLEKVGEVAYLVRYPFLIFWSTS